MKLVVDRSACCGAGNCVRTAPDVFDQDDEEGLVVLLTPVVPPEAPPEVTGRVTLAADLCPCAAISLS